jgi:CRISPR-associated endonuclease Csn1
VRWGDSKSTDRLTPAQKDFLRSKLESTEKPSYSAIYKELDKAGLMQPDGLILNFHTPRRDDLRGNTTRARLRSLKLLDAFESLTLREQSNVFLALADDVNSPETWRHDSARTFVVSEYGDAVAGFIDQIADSEKGLDRLKAMDFEAGRVSYGSPALEALTKAMREEDIDEHSAINKLYPQHHKKQTATGYLAEVSTLELRSPVVEHALLYTRRELLAAVKRLGPPQAMVIELAKEVKSTLEKRQETTKKQNQQERENADARNEILKANCKITNRSIQRYKLWKEQSKRCPYSGEYIGSVEEAVSGSRYEIDHIVPQRLHGVGNRFEEVVLATKRFNQIKSGHETPYLAHKRLGEKIWDWAATEQALKLIESESKPFKRKAKLIRDQTEFRVDELDDDAFVDRQLQETQWIGRIVQSWCSQLCNDVTVVRGGLTAELRRDWGFHTVLEQVRIAEGRHDSEKARTLFYKPNRVGELIFDKRSDHRHHLIDACVIALSTRQNYTDAVKARNARAAGRKASYANPVCPIPSLREHLVKMLNGYCVWHVPDHKVAGLMFDQMPFGLGVDGQSLFKNKTKNSKKFNPKIDKLIAHTDRHGRNHQKAVLKSEAACFRVTAADGIDAVNIAQFKQKYMVDGAICIPKNERLIFKGDLLIFKGDAQVYKVAQLKEAEGVCAIHAVETATFDDLKTTGLNRKFGKVKDLLEAIVVCHPIELAIHAKAHKHTQ